MTIDDLEFRKIQYSRELAAYTLRQWNLTCESLENPRSFAAASANTAVSQQISRGRSGSRVRNGTGTDTARESAPAHVESSLTPRANQLNGRR